MLLPCSINFGRIINPSSFFLSIDRFLRARSHSDAEVTLLAQRSKGTDLARSPIAEEPIPKVNSAQTQSGKKIKKKIDID